MKNRSIAQIILINFFKTIGVIVLLLGVGVLSYYLTMLFLKQTQRVERSTQYEHVIDVNPGSMESSNLIYSYDKKSGKIDAMVLELFDAGTKNMTYVTIPASTQITISAKTYNDLLKKSSKLPQVITMSEISSYFEGDVKYEYGILILQEELKADIGYFTAMTSDEFNKCFEWENGKKKKLCPTKQLLDEAAKCSDESDMNDLIESKELKQVNREYIHTYRVKGQTFNKKFKLDKTKTAKMIEKIWEKKAYQSAQNSLGSTSSTENKGTVWIYNGSKITGLAAKYQKILQEDGYEVKGVGNATGNIRSQTVIYATKKKKANALKKYFKNPLIQTADNMSSGASVEIVLGTDDDIQ